MDDDICKYYHIHEKKLGEGGFAKVRLATHLVTRQFVAIKCLDKMKLGPELPRIYNEIECLKRLRHHNIARLYQVFETQTVIYLVLEYCAGGELFDYIVKKSKLDETESAQILYDLMRVLEFIHINGFAHRDLKPENVLFDDKHHIKLIDFGLAANCSDDNMASNRNQQPLDQLSTCCGSVTYAAPEVIAGGRYSGTQIDVWSAGVMLYALLVGQLPFNDNNIQKLYQKIKGGLKSLPSFLSQEARDLIKKMLSIDPNQRITVREVLSHPWLRNRSNSFARINRRLEFSTNHIDEQLFVKCCEKFPKISTTKLKQYIQQDFNYYSTTYHLLQAKFPPRAFGIKRTPERQLVTPNNNSATPAPQQSNQQPYVSPTKRTRFADTLTTSSAPPTPKSPPVCSRQYQTAATATPKPTVVMAGIKRTPDRQCRVHSTSPYTSPVRRTRFITVSNTPRTPKQLPSYLQHLQETPKAATIASIAVSNSTTPATITKMKNGSLTTTTTTSTNKTPIKLTDQQENSRLAAFIYGPTPTPKKSIVKRLIESATPKKFRRQVCKKRCVCK